MTNLTLRSGAGKMHPIEFKPAGSKEHLVGRNGEINASSNRDILQQMAKLFEGMSRGEII